MKEWTCTSSWGDLSKVMPSMEYWTRAKVFSFLAWYSLLKFLLDLIILRYKITLNSVLEESHTVKPHFSSLAALLESPRELLNTGSLGPHPQICWFNWSEVGPGLSEKLPQNFLYEIRVESHWLKGAPEVFQLYSPLYIIKSPSLTVLLDCGVETRWWVAHSCDTTSIFKVMSVERSCSLSYLLICALVWQRTGCS